MDVQRARLLGAIVTAVQTLDDPERFDEYLRALGRDHRKFHVEPEHYEVVGGALIEAMRTFAGRAVEHRVRPGVGRRVRGDRREDAGRRRGGHQPAVLARRGPRARAPRPRHRGLHLPPLQPLEYRAGQYVSVECPRYQPRLWRTYSMANAPRKDNTLEFHVRALGAGWVSSALVRRVQVGDMIRLAAPMGSMTLDRRSTRDIVFVAGGTGLAPIKALVEELTRYNRTRWVHVFFGAKDRDDLYDLAELNRLAARYPWLSVVPACSDDPGFAGEQGNISEVVARYGPWDEHDFFVSGSRRDGQGDAAHAGRAAGAVDPDQVRRLRRHVRSVAPGLAGLPVLRDRHQRRAGGHPVHVQPALQVVDLVATSRAMARSNEVITRVPSHRACSTLDPQRPGTRPR